MAQHFPYTYISCPCSDGEKRVVLPKRSSRDVELDIEAEEEGKPFDPWNLRSSFSLFPPEHLLYCEECHDIKCPRCITEEIICWYCPGCLFEVPSSSVKSDDNRCSRNCFSCPICTTQLITASTGDKSSGPYILSCNYCMWSSLDIGLKFESPNQLRQVIEMVGIGGLRKKSSKQSSGDPGTERLRRNLSKMSYGSHLQPSRDTNNPDDEQAEEKEKKDSDQNVKNRTEPNAQFAALKAFYKDQIASTAGGVAGPGLDNFASPSSLSRILSMYNNPGGKALKTTKSQTTPMREALTASEGFILQNEIDTQSQPIHDYLEAVTPEQQSFQHPRSIGNPDAKHVSQLWPMSTKLRTKRSKRCAECKHILVKPEFKVTSTRYRIKLIASNYMPLVSLKPVPLPGGLKPPGPDGMDIVLQPGKASQWIMKLTNPLFENVNVSLGSPSVTPGKHGHKVTILCPQFSIGKNGDVWDDALNSGGSTLTKTVTNPEGVGEQIAGKVYESGRNWASVVVEVIPALIERKDDGELDEDEDVIEVPIRVRVEWTVTDEDPERIRKKSSDKAMEDEGEIDDGKRELAYWMVIGIGRVAI